MNIYPLETIKALSDRREALEKAISIIDQVKKLFFTKGKVVYEAHIQAEAPAHRSIMAEGSGIFEAAEKAFLRNQEWNQDTRRRGVEIFVRIDGLRIALMPEDAAAISSFESGQEVPKEIFHLDARTTEYPSPLAFGLKEEMPSCWYATKPTPKKQPALQDKPPIGLLGLRG